MPRDVIPYLYPDKLTELWADWSDEYLIQQPELRLRVRTGFQDIAASDNSTDRSRALEMYNIGFLRGPLIPPQTSGRGTLPLGWQLLSDNEHVHTSFGYLAYLIGEARKSVEDERINAAASALAALFAIQSHVILADGTRFSYVALFEWLKLRFPRPTDVSHVTWLRYLATGMFCTIKVDDIGERLASEFRNDDASLATTLTFIWGGKTTITRRLEVGYDDFCQLLRDKPSLTTIKPRKHSLFWIGKEEDQRGLYSEASRSCASFLTAYGLEEARILRATGNDQNEPFLSVYQKDTNQISGDILSTVTELGKIASLVESVNSLMKTLREGTVEAVRHLYGEEAVAEVTPPPRPATLPTDLPYQKILFGPPGTGKSHTAEEDTAAFIVKRTTFHPDADFVSFVGSYKPFSDGVNIKYGFRPQVFAETYLAAWLDPDHAYFLLIEEINRGNCAQIFGDLFQSLDRNKHGLSRYPVKADTDLATWLKAELGKVPQALERYEAEMKGRKLVGNDWIILPRNLYLWATMNTSDQSLFPMDSAFKRRWDWQYIPIDLEDAKKVTIDLGANGSYNWGEFIEVVNKKIYELLQSEDKQLGNRFVNPNGNPRVISIDEFKAKVLFYLWSEIYKLETESPDSIFYYQPADMSAPKERFTFASLYEPDANTRILPSFMQALVKLIPARAATTTATETGPSADGSAEDSTSDDDTSAEDDTATKEDDF